MAPGGGFVPGSLQEFDREQLSRNVSNSLKKPLLNEPLIQYPHNVKHVICWFPDQL